MAAKPQPKPEAERPFPAQKCYMPGCEREGTGTLHHAGKPRAMSVKGTDGKEQVFIYPMRCRYDTPYRHLHTSHLGPHGEPLTPVPNGPKHKNGCWIFTDAITGETTETESALPRINATPEKRRKQSDGGKRAWKKARNTGTYDARVAQLLEVSPTTEQKKQINLDRYGDPDHPKTWTPEQRKNRENSGYAQKALWRVFTPDEEKSQIKRRTAGNQRPEVKEKLGRSSTKMWDERKARTLPADLAKQSPLYRMLVPVLIADRAAGGHISNDELRAMFRIATTDRHLHRIRDYCGVPGQGRPTKDGQ